MPDNLHDIPDPIERNRGERRLAWVILAALLALAAAGWFAGGGSTPADATVNAPAAQP